MEHQIKACLEAIASRPYEEGSPKVAFARQLRDPVATNHTCIYTFIFGFALQPNSNGLQPNNDIYTGLAKSDPIR